jgi:hypothetical protein
MHIHTIKAQNISKNQSLVKPIKVSGDYQSCKYSVSIYGSFTPLNKCRYPTVARHGSQPTSFVSFINHDYININ